MMTNIMLANVLCTFLHAVLLLQLQVLLPEGVDGVNHDLDQLDLGVSQPVLVGDIVGVASLTTGLSTGAAGLDCQLLSASLQFVNALLGPAGEVDVDGGPHAGAEVGGAGVDVSVLLGQSVLLPGLGLDGLLDGGDAAGQAGEDSLDVAALLHGDDAGLVLLVDPQQEGLGVVVEDSTALGPVTLHTGNLERRRVSILSSCNFVQLTVRFLSPDTKRKWSSTSCCLTASSIPVRG